MANLNHLKGLKLVSINTYSLNLSSRQSLVNSLNLFNQKVEGILNLNADMICLQDVRLGSDGQQILQKSLDFHKYNHYKLYANSTKRGVTILFKFTIQHEVLDMKMCPDENYLLLKVKIRNCEFIIGSIYSDIYYKQPIFLNKWKQDITSLNCENILIACDFNAVTNPTKISINNLFNIDAVNENKFQIRKIAPYWMSGQKIPFKLISSDNFIRSARFIAIYLLTNATLVELGLISGLSLTQCIITLRKLNIYL